MEGVGRISLALATLTEDPGEEDRIDEGGKSINQSINIKTMRRVIVLMKVTFSFSIAPTSYLCLSFASLFARYLS